jgi:hypothetical protein
MARRSFARPLIIMMDLHTPLADHFSAMLSGAGHVLVVIVVFAAGQVVTFRSEAVLTSSAHAFDALYAFEVVHVALVLIKHLRLNQLQINLMLIIDADIPSDLDLVVGIEVEEEARLASPEVFGVGKAALVVWVSTPCIILFPDLFLSGLIIPHEVAVVKVKSKQQDYYD